MPSAVDGSSIVLSSAGKNSVQVQSSTSRNYLEAADARLGLCRHWSIPKTGLGNVSKELLQRHVRCSHKRVLTAIQGPANNQQLLHIFLQQLCLQQYQQHHKLRANQRHGQLPTVQFSGAGR